MKHIEDCQVIKNEEIVKDIFKMEIRSEIITKDAKAGQFVQIKVTNGNDPLLRRPISINEISREDNIITLYYKVVGKGTDILSSLQKGSILNVIGPLGNGFNTYIKNKKVAIVGGGIGIAPLLELAKVLKKENSVYTYLGFNDETYLEDSLKEYSEEVAITTVTGSKGYKGFITDVFVKDIESKKFDIVYSCGPHKMLEGVMKISKKNNIKCQVSLEERMACGIGACLGCSIETTNGIMKKVCVDGPVFWSDEVKINE